MDDLRDASARIETLLHELDAHPDATVPPRMRELVSRIAGLYGAGLDRMLQIARADREEGHAFVARLADDPVVAPLLVVHGLHPDDVATRVGRAVDRVRARSVTRGLGVALESAVPPVARIRIDALTRVCGDPRAEIAAAIEDALGGTAPEIERVEVVGWTAPPASPLLQIARGPADAGVAPGR